MPYVLLQRLPLVPLLQCCLLRVQTTLLVALRTPHAAPLATLHQGTAAAAQNKLHLAQ